MLEDQVSICVTDTKSTNSNVDRIKLSCWYVTAVTTLGSVCYGFDVGATAGTFVLDGFRTEMGWGDAPSASEHEELWISSSQGRIFSCLMMGSVVGSLLSGTACDYIGRRRTLLIGSGLFSIAALVQGLSTALWILLLGRILTGIASGLMLSASATYLAEVSPAKCRGTLISFVDVSVCIGVCIGTLTCLVSSNWEQGWRICYSGGLVFSFSMFFLIMTLHETPWYLVTRNKIDQARESLRVTMYEEEGDEKFEEICRSSSQCSTATWLDIFKTPNRQYYRTMLGVFLAVGVHFTGVEVAVLYAPTLLAGYLETQQVIACCAILSVVELFATLCGSQVVDRFGRVTLLVVGATALSFVCFSTAFFTSSAVEYWMDTSTQGIVLAILLCALSITFSLTWGPVICVLYTEIQPHHTRGKAVGLVVAVEWAMCAIAAQTAPLLFNESTLGKTGTFCLYGGLNLALQGLAWAFCPETQGSSVEEMDEIFKSFRPRRLSCAPSRNIEEKTTTIQKS